MSAAPVLALHDLAARRGRRTLWSGMDLDVAEGEFVAVLGPNGTGKTTLLEILLGRLEPGAGTVRIDGRPPGRRGARVGYVPQQHGMDPGLTMRGRDLVGLGIDGERWGPGLAWLPGPARRERDRRIGAALDELDAGHLAGVRAGRMSGGEQQRVRMAQALAGDPRLLLCDEPLLSLDLAGQRTMAGALRRRRDTHGTAVVMVTHEINPVLPLVDRVVYLAGGRCAVGTPDEVLTSATLSELFDSPVDVLHVRGQIVVVGDAGPLPTEPHAPGHHEHTHDDGRA